MTSNMNVATIPVTVGQQGWGDTAAAVAAQLEALAQQSATMNQRGYTTPCRVAFRLKSMEVGYTIPAVVNYGDIWKVVCSWIGEEQLRVHFGITSLVELMSPTSPVKVAFARQMPRGATMPDEIVTDGNDAQLIAEVHTSLLMDILTGGDREPEVFEFA